MNNADILTRWIDEQEKFYPVIVIGELVNKRILTPKCDVTTEKCQEIVRKLAENGIVTDQGIKIMMSQYDYADIAPDDVAYIFSGDIGLKLLIDKTAYYYPKTNTLQIWVNGLPVYENANGNITTDGDALADCLL